MSKIVTVRCWALMALTGSFLLRTADVAAVEAGISDNTHLGAASCGNAVCHGSVTPVSNKDVALNEYRIWAQQDRHSQSYRTLGTKESQLIAAKLGLPSASTAKICLDCHADNVPNDKRGPKFQISDGVACEACHGGSQKWINSHSAEAATHKDNLARGMYATESPIARASLCLSCHLGTKDKFATHAIMGAGHPRLTIELETFTNNQPAHFVVDADYLKRKGKIEGVNLWLAGQVETARRYLTLIQGPLFQAGGTFPELAFYDCYGCHHPLEDKRWTAQRVGPGIKPGTFRLQSPSIVILQAVSEVIGQAEASAELPSAREAFVRAGQGDITAVRSAATRLLNVVENRESWVQRKFSTAEITNIRRRLLSYAMTEKASDFQAAEQVVLSVESLSYSLGDHDRRKNAIDALYDTVKSSKNYNPTRFADVARSIQSQF